MQRNAHTPRRARPCRIIPHAPIVWRGALLGAVLGCHPDAPTAPVAPTSPALNVSRDGTWIVNSLADPGDGSCTNSECTLREAIGEAQNGDRITFKGNLSGRIALTTGRIDIAKNLTIEARDPGQVIVDGQGASGVFAIVGGGLGVLVNLSGLTITGGNTSDGGGVQVSPGGTLNLIGSVVTGNTGGGISAADATVRVIGSTIAGNSSSEGGGIRWTFSGGTGSGSLTVARSTLSGNTAAFAGGGIMATCSEALGCPSGDVLIRSSTITQNEALTFGGGGLLVAGIAADFSNSIVAGNRHLGTLDSGVADCHSAPALIVSLGYNLTSAATGCAALTSPIDVILQNPTQLFTFVLQPVLAENGSPRPTHALIERGLAVDAGYCPGENGDQRGFPRPYDDPRMPNALDGCDIGAFEWNPPSTKKTKP